MIPVLIAPVINRFDLLERMLLSTDQNIGLVLIVDNSCSDYYLPYDLEKWLTNGTGTKIGYIRPYTGLGYGGAINQGITQTAYAPWWLWVSNDIVFGKGDLYNITQVMDDNAGKPTFVSYGYTYGAINPEAIDLAGLVDEWNFHPIYEDDIDHYRRMRLAGVNIVDYKGLIQHGDNDLGSLTIRSDPALNALNSKSHAENRRRYIEKWGGYRGEEKFDTPFDKDYPLWYTKPDIRGRAARMW